jgi:hypothetical protein
MGLVVPWKGILIHIPVPMLLRTYQIKWRHILRYHTYNFRIITNDDFRRQQEAVMLHALSICLDRLIETADTSEHPEPGTISIRNGTTNLYVTY